MAAAQRTVETLAISPPSSRAFKRAPFVLALVDAPPRLPQKLLDAVGQGRLALRCQRVRRQDLSERRIAKHVERVVEIVGRCYLHRRKRLTLQGQEALVRGVLGVVARRLPIGEHQTAPGS